MSSSLVEGFHMGVNVCLFSFLFSWNSLTIKKKKTSWLNINSRVLIHMEKAMAPHSSTLAWKIPWTEGPGGLQSMGSLGVGHN